MKKNIDQKISQAQNIQDTPKYIKRVTSRLSQTEQTRAKWKELKASSVDRMSSPPSLPPAAPSAGKSNASWECKSMQASQRVTIIHHMSTQFNTSLHSPPYMQLHLAHYGTLRVEQETQINRIIAKKNKEIQREGRVKHKKQKIM